MVVGGCLRSFRRVDYWVDSQAEKLQRRRFRSTLTSFLKFAGGTFQDEVHVGAMDAALVMRGTSDVEPAR